MLEINSSKTIHYIICFGMFFFNIESSSQKMCPRLNNSPFNEIIVKKPVFLSKYSALIFIYYF